MATDLKHITVQYFAMLREARGCSQEIVETSAETPRQLFDELRRSHDFLIDRALLKVAINEAFKSWDTPLQSGDQVVFIPPVAGG
jgi:molybdopterin converting factor small subunit